MLVTQVALTALLTFSGSDLSGQTTSASSPPAGDGSVAETASGAICVSVLHRLAIVTTGKGKNKLEFVLGSGGCETRDVSVLTARYADDDSRAVAVYSHSCPAFQVQAAQLPSPKSADTLEHARAGRYMVEDRWSLFNLKTSNGRKAAAQWLRQTIAVVRPCWSINTENDSESIVNAIYPSARPRNSIVPVSMRGDRHARK